MTSKRSINATNETELLSQVVKPIVFARLDFPSGVQRFHTEIGPITATHPLHGAESYLGVGDFGGISGGIVESVDSAPQRVVISITGVKSAFNNLVLTDNYYHRDIELMLGLENSSGALVANPEVIYSGFMDSTKMSLDADIGVIEVTSESRAMHLLRASDWRFSDEDLQVEYSGDLFGEYIYRMADLQLFWGQKVMTAGDWSPNAPQRVPNWGLPEHD